MDDLGIAQNRISAIAALGDDTRRALYALVARAPEPIGRDEAAALLDLARSTTAFHLDRLVEAGLLSVERRRLSGRTGPGAGRPAKLYAIAPGEIVASAPERHYELAGELLATAAETADREGIPVREALAIEAHATGLRIGAHTGNLDAALIACGYEPLDDGRGGLTLENCPFHSLAARHTALVCTANLQLLEGMVEGCRDHRLPVLTPDPPRCCVALLAEAAQPPPVPPA